MKIHRDDTVMITLGKDAGKSGKVVRVLGKEGQILVEGINMVKRHLRKVGQSGGREVELAKPVNVSNVMLVCPKCKKTTRVGFKVDGNKKIRICKKCQEVIAT